MPAIRSLLVRLTVIWLSVHVLTIAGSALAIVTAGESRTNVVCTCVHGAGHTYCPMHRAPADSSRCRMQSTPDSLAAALTSVLGPLVLPGSADTIVLDAPVHTQGGYVAPLLADWFVPPDPPPPRA